MTSTRHQVRVTSLPLVGSLAAALAALNVMPAAAVIVDLNGKSYDILTTNRSYADEPSLFTSTSMPWLSGNINDNSDAYDFAQTAGSLLGSNSYPGFDTPGGPLFAYAVEEDIVYSVFQDLVNSSIQNELLVPRSSAFNYAYIKQRSTPPVPGPLPLAAAVIGAGWSRHLRRRLASARNSSQR
jgi:hypothetical protein